MMPVEHLSKEYIKEIAEIEKDCFAFPISEKGLELFLSAPFDCLCCIVDDNLVAYVTLQNAPDEIQIVNIATKKSERRKGYASILLDNLCNKAKEENKVISLEVRESNLNAIALYHKFGFDIVGKRKNFYKSPVENAEIMIFNPNK